MRLLPAIVLAFLLLFGLAGPVASLMQAALPLPLPQPFPSVAFAAEEAGESGKGDKGLKSENGLKSQTVLKKETALEAQVRVVASKLRCPVCQGESVYDSHSDVAEEMKRLIAEKLTAGESEAAILDYFQDRYGNFILMEPPVEGLHWVIWVFPLFLALVGFLLVSQYISATRQRAAEVAGDVLKREDDQSGPEGNNGDDVPDVRELRL